MKSKKLFSYTLSGLIALVGLLICSTFGGYAAQTDTLANDNIYGIMGDTDFNGKIEIRDVSYIQNAVAGYFDFSQEANILGDVNADGVVDIRDGVYIQKYLAGYTTDIGQTGQNYYVTPTETTETTIATTTAPTTVATTATTVPTTAVTETTEPPTTAKNYVYLQNDAGWSNCYAYTWKTGLTGSVTWPGTKMENVSSNLYRIELTSDDNMIIFDAGSGQSQTADLTIPTNGNNVYNNSTMVWSTNIEPTTSSTQPTTQEGAFSADTYDGSYYIMMYNSANWSNCYASVWNSSNASSGEWPGTEMTYIGNNVYQVKVDADSNAIVLNSGTGQKSYTHYYKTSDLIDLYDNGTASWEYSYYAVKNNVTREQEKQNDLKLQKSAFDLLTKTEYSSATWDTLDIEGKQQVLRNLVGELNKIMKLSVNTDITFFDDTSNTVGAFSGGTNKIKINLKYVRKTTGYDCVKTIFHEMRHAYQRYSEKFPHYFTVSDETVAQLSKNQAKYISSSEGWEQYVMQPLEYDSRCFAKQYSTVSSFLPVYVGSWDNLEELIAIG